MPFVTSEHRQNPDQNIPGDRCYLHYRCMTEEWRRSPRWTTVDNIAALLWDEPSRRARILAFLVFFCLQVLPYELEKRRENGDIT